jgi:hypothetical protein
LYKRPRAVLRAQVMNGMPLVSRTFCAAIKKNALSGFGVRKSGFPARIFFKIFQIQSIAD